jgi:hypothetical protein
MHTTQCTQYNAHNTIQYDSTRQERGGRVQKYEQIGGWIVYVIAYLYSTYTWGTVVARGPTIMPQSSATFHRLGSDYHRRHPNAVTAPSRRSP